jgi:hypothetical protein
MGFPRPQELGVIITVTPGFYDPLTDKVLLVRISHKPTGVIFSDTHSKAFQIYPRFGVNYFSLFVLHFVE